MVTTPRGINAAIDGCPRRNRSRREMNDPAIVIVSDIHHGNTVLSRISKRENSGVMDLATTGRIKSRLVEHDSGLPVPFHGLQHLCLEYVEKRVVIVEAGGHRTAISK